MDIVIIIRSSLDAIEDIVKNKQVRQESTLWQKIKQTVEQKDSDGDAPGQKKVVELLQLKYRCSENKGFKQGYNMSYKFIMQGYKY